MNATQGDGEPDGDTDTSTGAEPVQDSVADTPDDIETLTVTVTDVSNESDSVTGCVDDDSDSVDARDTDGDAAGDDDNDSEGGTGVGEDDSDCSVVGWDVELAESVTSTEGELTLCSTVGLTLDDKVLDGTSVLGSSEGVVASGVADGVLVSTRMKHHMTNAN